jgi:hypothetical protein
MHTYSETLKKKVEKDGSTTITQTKKITYSQDWKAYNKAQTSEIELFDQLLRDLVEGVEEPPHKQTGRPPLSLRESLYCCIEKVYSQLSQRRAHTLYRNAERRGQIEHTP